MGSLAIRVPTIADRLAGVLNAGVFDHHAGLKRSFLATYKVVVDNHNVLPLIYSQSKYSRFRVDVKGSKGTVYKVDDWSGVNFPETYCLPPHLWPADVRAFVYGDQYDSLDLHMSHNTFFVQLCEQAGIETPVHRDFMARRDEYIKSVTDFDDALAPEDVKGPLFHRIMYGGGYKGYLASLPDGISLPPKPPTKVLQFSEEIYDTVPQLYEKLPDKADIMMDIGSRPCPPKFFKKFEFATRDAKKKMMHSVVSRKCMQLETAAIKAVMDWCRLAEVDCGIYVNDELHVQKGTANIEGIQELVKKVTGFDVTFKIKPMERREDWLPFQGPLTDAGATIGVPAETEEVIVRDDVEAADVIMQRLADVLRKADDNRVFIKNDNVWVSDQNLVDSILRQHVLRSGINRVDKEGCKPYAAMVTHARNIVTAIRDLLPVTDNFIKLLRESSVGKLCFKNGVYDFKTKRLLSYEESGVYTMVHTGRDYVDHGSIPEFLAVKAEVKRMVFEGALGKQADMYNKRLARGLAGHIVDKVWTVMEGLRNSGKGALLKWLQTAFGKYVVTIIAENFLLRPGDSNAEEALKGKWMIDCEYARLAFSSEIKMDPDSKIKLSGNDIKKFASGGDTVQVREIKQKQFDIVVNTMLTMMCNALPPVSPPDALETMEYYSCPYKYVPVLPEGQDGTGMFRLADDAVKTTLLDKKYAIDAFISIVLDAYEETKPVPTAEVRANSEEFREDGGDNSMNWQKWFKFTGNDEDFIAVSEIKQFLAGKKLKISPKMLQTQMEGYGAWKTREVDANNGRWGFKGVMWGVSDDPPMFV